MPRFQKLGAFVGVTGTVDFNTERPYLLLLRIIRWIDLRIAWLIESLAHFSHLFIQFVQIDIGKNRGNDTALRSTAVGIVKSPILHIAGLQEPPNQLYELGILDFRIDNIYQRLMVDIVKAAFDISFHEPNRSVKLMLEILECRMTASVRSEPIRKFAEYRLIYRFQYHTENLLHKLVRERWQSQGTGFAVCLGNVGTACRIGTVGTIRQALDNGAYFLSREAVCRIIVNALGRRALICVQLLVGHIINVLTEQISVQPCEYFLLVVHGVPIDFLQNFNCWLH